MEFPIVNDELPDDPIAKMVSRYKKLIAETHLADEIYKWQLTKKYHQRPDISVKDFLSEVSSIDYKNLVYPLGRAVLVHIAKERPEELRQAFKGLFDNAQDLQTRVRDFSDVTFKLYRDIQPDNKTPHHQDERSIATYLAFYDCAQYPFFKDSFYQKYCKLIGVKAKDKGEKYVHYIDLLKELIEDYILPDQELLDLKAKFITAEESLDKSHLILAQDMLYQILDKSVDRERRYWRIGTKENDIHYWDLMLDQKYISVGWPNLEDLREENVENRQDIIKLFEKVEYYIDKPAHVKSRKAGELLNFYKEIKIDDVVLAQDGNKVNGIGIVKDEYQYLEGLPFPHTREVDWKIIEPKGFTNGQGPQTTVYELTDPILIDRIDTLLSQARINEMSKDISLNTILYGPPGTGKTYHTIDFAVQIASLEKYEEGNHDKNKDTFDKLIKSGQVVFTTFHQSMCYEDFIEGIKPLKPEESETHLKYDVQDGIFKKICFDAQTPNLEDFDEAFKKLKETFDQQEFIELKTPTGKPFAVSFNRNGNLTLHTGPNKNAQGTLTRENIQRQINGENVFYGWQGYFSGLMEHLKSEYNYDPGKSHSPKNYVLIIDEINRGNIAEIFGELITLIEEDKRLNKKETLHITLPYSKQEFSVPDNLYIIGTMNTADRSVEALDTALRRRFSFREMMPNYTLKGLEKNIFGISMTDLLLTINKRIEKLVDRDHQIGHSYFLDITEEKELQRIFKDKVVPLLQEYFYGDYQKLGRVLGKGFVSSIDSKDDIFADFSVDDLEIYNRPDYNLNPDPFESLDNFQDALNTLMKFKSTNGEG